MIICYLIAAVGSIMMLAYGLNHTSEISFPLIFLLCRFGISGVDVPLGVAIVRVFDTERSATAFGLGSLFARLTVSAAPLASTIP